jgi:hypothetical protein
MSELLKVHVMQVGEQPLVPDITIIDVHAFGWAFLSPSGWVRMSRPGLRVSRLGYPGYFVGNNAAGLPVGKTPTETYVKY